MKKIDILSPITSNKSVIVERHLNHSFIIKDYNLKYGVDVSRLFKECKEGLLLCRCLDTDYRFYLPFSVAGDGRFYDEVLNKSPYYPKWKKEYQFALDIVRDFDGMVKVLDVGCGNGTFLEGVTDENVEVMGLEFNDTAIDTCLKMGFEVEKKTIQSFAIDNRAKYDVVCAFQVLEHVPEVKSFLDACIKCLKPGGKLIISVPNNNPYYAGYNVYATANLPPHHMGLWSIKSLKNLEKYFPIVLKDYDYDLTIPLLNSVFYRGQYYVNNWFPHSKNKLSGKIVSAIISCFFLPVELINQKFGKDKRNGRVMTMFEIKK